MKIEELFEKKSEKPGTYAGVHFSPETVRSIQDFMKEHSVPHPVDDDKLHTTVLYSRKHCPNFEARGDIKPPIFGEAEEFAIWPSRSGTNCLVLKYKCPDLVARHKALMDEHNATYDFPEYVPHVTFSYDSGDLDVATLNTERALKSLAKLEIVNEYGEDLNEDWANNSST